MLKFSKFPCANDFSNLFANKESETISEHQNGGTHPFLIYDFQIANRASHFWLINLKFLTSGDLIRSFFFVREIIVDQLCAKLLNNFLSPSLSRESEFDDTLCTLYTVHIFSICSYDHSGTYICFDFR